MGTVMMLTNLGATNHPMPAPTPTATRELMMRLRSSIRCSKKVICPPEPSSGSCEFCGLASSWLSVVMGGRIARLGSAGSPGTTLLLARGFARGSARHGFVHRRNHGFLGFGRRGGRFRGGRKGGRFGGGGFVLLLPLRLAVLSLDVAHLLFEGHAE